MPKLTISPATGHRLRDSMTEKAAEAKKKSLQRFTIKQPLWNHSCWDLKNVWADSLSTEKQIQEIHRIRKAGKRENLQGRYYITLPCNCSSWMSIYGFFFRPHISLNKTHIGTYINFAQRMNKTSQWGVRISGRAWRTLSSFLSSSFSPMKVWGFF